MCLTILWNRRLKGSLADLRIMATSKITFFKNYLHIFLYFHIFFNAWILTNLQATFETDSRQVFLAFSAFAIFLLICFLSSQRQPQAVLPAPLIS